MDLPTIAISRKEFFSIPEVYSSDYSQPFARYRCGNGQWVMLGAPREGDSEVLKALAAAVGTCSTKAVLVVLTDWEEGDGEGLKPSQDLVLDPAYDPTREITITASGFNAAMKAPEPKPAGPRVSKHRGRWNRNFDRSKRRRLKQIARKSQRRNRR